jgi:hypothetical protein
MITSIDPDVPTVIVTHDPGVGRYIGDLIKVHRPEINYTDYGSGKTKIITVKRDEDLRLLRGWSGAVKVDHAVLDNIDRRVLGLLEAVCEKVAVEKADRDRARQGR